MIFCFICLSGKLEIKPSNYEALKSVAQSLELNVLLKLMEATEKGGLVDTANPKASSTASTTTSSKKRKRLSAFDQDPVQQMKKIKKVERRFEMETKRAKLLEERQRKTAAAAAAAASGGTGSTLPGKKLPIWKKRFVAIAH